MKPGRQEDRRGRRRPEREQQIGKGREGDGARLREQRCLVALRVRLVLRMVME